MNVEEEPSSETLRTEDNDNNYDILGEIVENNNKAAQYIRQGEDIKCAAKLLQKALASTQNKIKVTPASTPKPSQKEEDRSDHQHENEEDGADHHTVDDAPAEQEESAVEQITAFCSWISSSLSLLPRQTTEKEAPSSSFSSHRSLFGAPLLLPQKELLPVPMKKSIQKEEAEISTTTALSSLYSYRSKSENEDDELYCSTLCASIIIYNLALCYHLQGRKMLSKAEVFSSLPARGGRQEEQPEQQKGGENNQRQKHVPRVIVLSCLFKAKALYEKALRLFSDIIFEHQGAGLLGGISSSDHMLLSDATTTMQPHQKKNPKKTIRTLLRMVHYYFVDSAVTCTKYHLNRIQWDLDEAEEKDFETQSTTRTTTAGGVDQNSNSPAGRSKKRNRGGTSSGAA